MILTKGLSSFIAKEEAIKIGESNRLIEDGEGAHEWIKLFAETGADVADDLVIGQGMTSDRHRVRQGLHLLVVLGHGQVVLLGAGELAPDGVDGRPVMGSEQGVERLPDGARAGVGGHLREDVDVHVGEKGADDDLILAVPDRVRRVGDVVLHLSFSLRQVLGRRGDGSVEVPEEIGTIDGWHDLSLPHREVGAVKVDGDEAGEAGGGRHGGHGGQGTGDGVG